MRVAFFSPLPPTKSGIADYSAALLPALEQLADITVFSDSAAGFDPAKFDICLYQIGNNPYHTLAYETALRHPGVVVMHESNLHHLMTDLTIRRGDWDAYLAELEYDGGAEALAFGRRVRALEVGPDYEGVPMMRRLLQSSRAAIVHSRCVEADLRQSGFAGSVGVIPHGSWVIEPDGRPYRERLGVSLQQPLIGIFGFLKPYKRIAEALRAFRRLLRQEPSARLILVGEPHPELQLGSLLRTLGLTESVRVLGFTEIDDFNGYLAACDIVLNLRYPTVGESSGTLLRAFGMGRAVIVSDIGSFREYPDEICLKTPVDAHEEHVLFEYLAMLTARPELAQALGARAKQWVSEHCRWDRVAQQYTSFLRSVLEGSGWHQQEKEIASAPPELVPPPSSPPPAELVEEIVTWSPPSREARVYLDLHLARLTRTLELIPTGGPHDRILEMGAYLQITPALQTKLGYGEVRGCYYGPQGRVDHKEITSAAGRVFTCEVDHFDAEKDVFPYPDEHFSTVVCGELIEHLTVDPFHMMGEIHRVLKSGGTCVLTTPNAASFRALSAILQGYHPGFFPAYIRPATDGEETEARHNREYTPSEVRRLFEDAGFEVTRLETGEFRDEPRPEFGWIRHMLEQYRLPGELRGDDIYVVGRKSGPMRARYPAWLYSGGT